MKKTTNKILAILLSVVLFITSVPIISLGSDTLDVTIDISNHKYNWHPDEMCGVKFREDMYAYSNVLVECIDIFGNKYSKVIYTDNIEDDIVTLSFSLLANPKKLILKFFNFLELYPKSSVLVNEITDLPISFFDVSIPFYGNKKFSENEIENYSTQYIETELEFSIFGEFIVTLCSAQYTYDFNNTVLSDSYNYYEDSYYFGNFGDESLSKKYFTGLFNSANAEQIYKANKNADGLCCGFAYTTAAINKGLPSVDTIYDKSLTGSQTYISTLRDAEKTSKIKIGDKTITVSDYIKYAYVYQMSQDVMQQRVYTGFTSTEIEGYEYLYDETGINELYNLVKTIASENNIGIIIWLNGLNIENLENPGCHTVLCVGVDDDCILIDDSNLREDHGFTDELSRLRINEDGTWVYEPCDGEFNSENTWISYAIDYQRPYSILSTGNKVVADDIWVENVDVGNNCIVGCKKIDAGKGVLYCDANEYELNNIEKTEFLDIGSGESAPESRAALYWVNADDTITITDIKNNGNNSEFRLSSGDTIAELNVSENSEITFNSDNSILIDAEISDEYTVSYAYCFEDAEDNYKDKVVRLSISGEASDEFIMAKIDNGIVEIEGISDGVITLSEDDETISTQEFVRAESKIEIIYDKTGEDESLDVSYVAHTHKHESEITKEPTHTTAGVRTYVCECGDTYTEQVAKLEGHSYTSSTTKKPTCTDAGVKTFTCACNDSYTESIPALGHKDDNGDYKCDNSCGYEYEKPAPEKPEEKPCDCNCHAGGIKAFFFKLINFFRKLFDKSAKICACGAAH